MMARISTIVMTLTMAKMVNMLIESFLRPRDLNNPIHRLSHVIFLSLQLTLIMLQQPASGQSKPDGAKDAE
jgi:energy-coupling factor transporter transmembrane protein EcfT